MQLSADQTYEFPRSDLPWRCASTSRVLFAVETFGERRIGPDASAYMDVELGEMWLHDDEAVARHGYPEPRPYFLAEHPDTTVVRFVSLPAYAAPHIRALMDVSLGLEQVESAALMDRAAVMNLQADDLRLALPARGEAVVSAVHRGEFVLVVSSGETLWVRRYVSDFASPSFLKDLREVRSASNPFYSADEWHHYERVACADGDAPSRAEELLEQQFNGERILRFQPLQWREYMCPTQFEVMYNNGEGWLGKWQQLKREKYDREYCGCEDCRRRREEEDPVPF